MPARTRNPTNRRGHKPIMSVSTLTPAVRQQDRSRWWEIHDPEEYVCPDCLRGADDVRGWEVHHLNRQPGKIVGLCEVCHHVRHGATRWRIDLETWKEEFTNGGQQ